MIETFAFTDHDLLVVAVILLLILIIFGGLGYWRRP